MHRTFTHENSNDSSCIKIEFPTVDDILNHKVKFSKKFDMILLFTQDIGTIDTNSYLSKIAFLKNNKIHLFCEYENPEHSSSYTLEFNESNYFLPKYENLNISCFFKEALNLHYNFTFPDTNKKTINKKI